MTDGAPLSFPLRRSCSGEGTLGGGVRSWSVGSRRAEGVFPEMPKRLSCNLKISLSENR